jgi:hypothetical protein
MQKNMMLMMKDQTMFRKPLDLPTSSFSLEPTHKNIYLQVTFKNAFEEANRISGNKNSFYVSTYNDPLFALSEFKPS